MKKIAWKTAVKQLSELKLLKNNPRKISKEEFKKFEEDFKVGSFKPLVCDFDLTILGGNQRYRYLVDKGETKHEVSMPDRKLNKREKQKVILLDNKHRGEFDMNILITEFEEDLLKELDFNIDFDSDFINKNKEIDMEDVENNLSIECPKCHFKFMKSV